MGSSVSALITMMLPTVLFTILALAKADESFSGPGTFACYGDMSITFAKGGTDAEGLLDCQPPGGLPRLLHREFWQMVTTVLTGSLWMTRVTETARESCGSRLTTLVWVTAIESSRSTMASRPGSSVATAPAPVT